MPHLWGAEVGEEKPRSRQDNRMDRIILKILLVLSHTPLRPPWPLERTDAPRARTARLPGNSSNRSHGHAAFSVVSPSQD